MGNAAPSQLTKRKELRTSKRVLPTMRVSDIKLLADRGYELIGNGESIGEGAYSKVQLFYSTHLQKNVAIKIINKSSAPRDFVQHFLPREIEVLQRVRHTYRRNLRNIGDKRWPRIHRY